MEEALKLRNQLCFPLYALSREIIGKYRPFLDELSLTYPQYLVLMVLWEQDRQTVNQIGEKLLLDTGTLTPLLKRMEGKGLLNRKRRTTDERVVEISLTRKGEELYQQAGTIPEKMFISLGLTETEMQQLKDITSKVLAKTVANCDDKI